MNMTSIETVEKTKNTASITNKLHKLIHITALLGITMFGSINTYATESLKDYFEGNNIISFESSTILNKIVEDGNVASTDITNNINPEEFIIDSGNNTTYIDTNTLPIQNSIGGGSKRKYRW